ncbi:MAG: Cholinephosphotransferase 1, variant 2 [Marteilia pararefringens]
MILIIIMYISIFLKSKMKTEISKAFVIYHFLFGVTISKITVRLIVATMTKSEFHVVDTEFIVPALIFFNQYFGYIFPETISVIYIGLLFNICNFAYFLINLTISISNRFKYSVMYVPNNKIA